MDVVDRRRMDEVQVMNSLDEWNDKMTKAEEDTELIPVKSFNISTRDYDDLMIMLLESRNRMQRIAQDGSRADKWCKNITKAIDKIEKKYKD